MASEGTSLPTPRIQASTSGLGDNIFLIKTPFVVLCYSSPSELIQLPSSLRNRNAWYSLGFQSTGLRAKEARFSGKERKQQDGQPQDTEQLDIKNLAKFYRL